MRSERPPQNGRGFLSGMGRSPFHHVWSGSGHLSPSSNRYGHNLGIHVWTWTNLHHSAWQITSTAIFSSSFGCRWCGTNRKATDFKKAFCNKRIFSSFICREMSAFLRMYKFSKGTAGSFTGSLYGFTEPVKILSPCAAGKFTPPINGQSQSFLFMKDLCPLPDSESCAANSVFIAVAFS